MKTEATVRLQFHSEKNLQMILNSIMPETESPATARSRAKLTKKGLTLVLTIETRDTVALRASLNTYLRWINSICNVLQVLEAY